jgi:hypothetical protein
MLYHLPRNIIGCALSAPDGSSPRGYSRKNIFSSIGSNYNVVHHTSSRNSLIITCYRIRVHHFREKLYSPFLKVVAPKAIIKTPSYTVLFIYFALVGAILLLSYIVFFMTSISTSLLYKCKPLCGQYCKFLNFWLLVGLPFPIFAPRLSPRSFSQKVYKGGSGGFYCLPAFSLRHRRHCRSCLLLLSCIAPRYMKSCAVSLKCFFFIFFW